MRANMRSERVRTGMTAAEAAQKIGVSTNTLLGWERGETEPKGVGLVTLARLYGVTPDYLLGISDERNRIVSKV